jgi:hypothetical protein
MIPELISLIEEKVLLNKVSPEFVACEIILYRDCDGFDGDS